MRPGRFVRLLVSDTGVGMDSEVAARAFEPMFTTKSSGQGTGLGLATVYTIVSQTGGMISLSSEPGAGTSIEIQIPATELGPARATKPTRAAPAGRGEAILIAEDDPAVRRVAERILSSAGYSVLSRRRRARGARPAGRCQPHRRPPAQRHRHAGHARR